MRRYVWLTLFAVAMGYLEAAVVVYLRMLYYPRGFGFPLAVMPGHVAGIEVAREAATILMLYAAGRLGAASGWQGFAGFMFVFGVWDIFYYVWLKVLVAWPASLATWDILFLIPVPWIGPVWAPIVVSLSLVVAALAVEYTLARHRAVRVSALECTGIALAGVIMIASFSLDSKRIVTGGGAPSFHPGLFWLGEAVALSVLVRGFLRSRSGAGRPSAAPEIPAGG